MDLGITLAIIGIVLGIAGVVHGATGLHAISQYERKRELEDTESAIKIASLKNSYDKRNDCEDNTGNAKE